MALHKRPELIKLLKITQPYFKVNLDRGKIVLNSEGLIDDTNPINADFISKRLDKNNSKLQDELTEIANSVKPTTKATEKVLENVANENKKHSKYELDRKKKELEVDKLSVDVKLKEVQLSKVRGELVPYDVVQELIAQFGKSLVSEFDNAADLVLQKITNQAKLNPALVAESREFIKTANNAAQKKAKVSTLKQMEIILAAIKE